MVGLFSLPAFAQVECEMLFQPAVKLDGTRSLSDSKELKFASYNVLNLEHSVGKYKTSEETGKRVFNYEVLTKNPEDVKKIAQIITEEKLDFIVLQEVEGIQALKLFNRNYLNNQYEPIVLPGNDTRGIEIGFLVKKDLPIKYKVISNREATHLYAATNEEIPIFSRDLPALHIWKQESSVLDDPEMIIFGNHLKSQRDRKEDAKSVLFRTAQVEEMTAIVSHYKEVYKDSAVFIAGDFNANLATGAEFKPLKAESGLKDSFDLNSVTMQDHERVTHSFHPRDGETSYSQMDAVFMNDKAQEYFIQSYVYRYQENGKVKPLPKTYEERELNPSDHYPVIVKIGAEILK